MVLCSPLAREGGRDSAPLGLEPEMTTHAFTPPARRESERDVLVATLYEQGVPVAEIARRAQVCVKTVRNVARRFGLPPRNPSHPERDRRVATLYAAGEKVATIAREVGISRPRVRVIAARAGLPPRSDWRRRYPLDETAFDAPTDVGWWLIGLLAADGSVNAKEQRVSLCQTWTTLTCSARSMIRGVPGATTNDVESLRGLPRSARTRDVPPPRHESSLGESSAPSRATGSFRARPQP